jgi:hypothetical protein
MRDKLAGQVLKQLAAGGKIEPGPRFPHVVDDYEGAEMRRRLVIE